MTTPGSDVDVSGLDGVQRMYILLEPEQPEGGKCRLLVVGKKRLPDTQKHERFLAFVGESLLLLGFHLLAPCCARHCWHRHLLATLKS